MSEPEVSWKAIEKNAQVFSSEGEQVGTVSEIAGDPEADIFNGLVISIDLLGTDRYLPAERVIAIRPDRVDVAATAAEIRALPAYREPVAERWGTPDDFMTRMRRFFGFYGKRDRD